MTADVQSRGVASRFPSARSVVTAPLRLQTYGNLAYIALSFPLGLLYFTVFVTAYSVSTGLVVVAVGIPLLIVTHLLTLVAGRFELAVTARFLDVEIEAPSHPYLYDGPPRDRILGLATDLTVWKSLVYLLSKFAFGTLVFVLLGVPLILCAVFLATPLYYDEPGVTVGIQLSEPVQLTPSLLIPWNELAVGIDTVVQITSWQVDTLPGAVAVSLAGLVALVLVLNVSNALSAVWGRYSRYMLAGNEREKTAN
jgi:hypothetical protein